MHVPKSLAAAAMVVGIAGGSYGIASAANGGSTTTGTTSQAAPGPPGSQPFGHQRSDETALTDDALAKVTAAAQAKVPGGTVLRVETDADGRGKYEAHMLDSSGNPITVYVDANYDVVGAGTPF
jgi:predicted enzyme related to lactoylglutathione lyase